MLIRRIGIPAAALCISLAFAASADAKPRAIGLPPWDRVYSGTPKKEANPLWSGYAVNAGSPFREIEGGWTMPDVTCRQGRRNAVSFWVGIGGNTPANEKVEQIGTDIECGRRGGMSRYAWFELFPAGPVVIPIKVGVGDQVIAGVAVRGNRVSMRLEDITSGASFSRTLSTRSPDVGSAEWIAETPPLCNPRACKYPLAPDFDPAEFVGARTATQDAPMSPINSDPFSVTTLLLVDSPGRKANIKGLPPLWGSNARVIPSELSASGESFTVTNEMTHGPDQ